MAQQKPWRYSTRCISRGIQFQFSLPPRPVRLNPAKKLFHQSITGAELSVRLMPSRREVGAYRSIELLLKQQRRHHEAVDSMSLRMSWYTPSDVSARLLGPTG